METATEYTNDDPEISEFFLDEGFRPKDEITTTSTEQTTEELMHEQMSDTLNTNDTNTDDCNNDDDNLPTKESSNYHDDNIPPEETSNIEDTSAIYDEYDTRDNKLGQMEFHSIVEHKFKDGVLIFKHKMCWRCR